MKLEDFRAEILQNNIDHPNAKQCIMYGCHNRIETDSWDNKNLCEEHNLLFIYWFYELDGFQYCPETWNLEDFPNPNKMLPKPIGSDNDMAAYRKRYCDWMAALSPEEYLRILKWSIGDDKE